VDLRRREASLDGEPLTLTPTEFRLLSILARRAGEAISQSDLIAEVWGDYRQRGGSALRRYIWFLRQKIEPDPERPVRLVTVRGFGYRLEES
jgi:two-component system KDP operon response regulator KdpE